MTGPVASSAAPLTRPSGAKFTVPAAQIGTAEVAEMLKLMARAVRAHQLYMANNPMHARAMEALRDSLTALWAGRDLIELRITEDEIQYDGDTVFSEASRGGESLPWTVYKDGIRSFEIRSGFEGQDLVKFLDALKATRSRGSDDDDLVTLFWESDFAHLGYGYVEAGMDGQEAPGADLLRGGIKTGVTKARPDEESDAGVYGAGASPFARIADFDPSLYFLDEPEIAYLQNAIREDFSGDLRPSVIAALLDTFESEIDADVRDEICGHVESLLITLLSTLQFDSVTYLLQEASAAVSRAESLLPAHRARLSGLVRHMSDPQVLDQLLATLEEAPVIPAHDDLVLLLARLDGRALAPVIAHLVRTRSAELRALLEAAAIRLATTSTAELILLIDSTDEMVALEAARRAGELRLIPAVAALIRLLGSANVEVRRGAAAALADVGSPGSMQALDRCLDDADRAIRICAVLWLSRRSHGASLPRIERALRGPMLRDGSAPERTAFLEAYASLGGDAAVPFLESVLAPRGFLSRKEDPATRASAAAALGKLRSPLALDALRRAAADKDIVVRTAVTRAIRGAE
ncbi:MAG: HEAT repeat domain-containing protein [Gemmatimonadaceae bacterium]